MRKLSLLLLLVLSAFQGWSATYYIDFAAGVDSNNGTSTSTPWKHHPYMVGWTGSYTHSAGDQFIFKGGVTWDHTCFPMNLSLGGSSSTVLDYYGVSSSYFTGGAWSRPIFNDNSNAVVFVQFSADNIMLDNIEMTNFWWNSTLAYGSGSYITLGTHMGIMTNCYFHGWAHGSSATSDNIMCILGSTSGTGTGKVTHCIFDGSPYGSNTMYAVYCVPNVDHCIVSNMANGLVFGAGVNCDISYNVIGPINTDFSGVHENAIEPEGSVTTAYIHNNVIFSPTAVCILLGDSGTTYYVYDNLITNSVPIPIQNDSSINTSKASTTYIWNNTLIGANNGGQIIRNVRGQNSYVIQNNHFIGNPVWGDSGAVVSLSFDHNYTNATVAAAVTAGYTYANNLQPQSSSYPTVDTGTTIATVTNDLLGVSRPQGSAYDIGAYEFVPPGNKWYVDNAASGANNGTNWANAWTSFGAITWASIHAGDTIYVSGGSTSKTYSDVWSVGASGSYGSPITITLDATNTSHNGLVIFDYNSQGDFCTTAAAITCNQNYVTFDGNVGGAPHFVVQNLRNITNRYAGDCWSVSGTSNVIRFVTTTNCNNPITFTSGLGSQINNSILAQTRGDRCIFLPSAGSGFDAVYAFSNICEILYNTSVPSGGTGPYLGPDGIQCGNGASMHDNKLIVTSTAVYTSSQHPDMCQCIGNYVKWYNNEIVNIGDSGFDYDCYANANPHDVWIFNNVYHITTWLDPFPEAFRLYASANTINSVQNFKFWNNTYEGFDGDQRVIWFDQFNGSNPAFSGMEFRNNIFYNCGTSSGYDQVIHVGSSTALTNGAFTFDYNVYYSTNAPEWIGYNGTTYSVTNWIASNEPHSRTNQPTFTSYTYRSANNDYRITTADTAALNLGTTITQFAFDHNNVARPQGSAWDIGAYEAFISSLAPYYVSPSGSSANTGLSTSSPWPLVYACQHVGNSNTIYMMDGVYASGSTLNIDITNVYVSIRAINKWGPLFMNVGSDGTGGILRVNSSQRGDGLVIDGLSVSNAQYYPFLVRYVGSSNCVIRNCWIRNTGQTYPSSSSASGIQFYPGFSNVVEYCLLEYNGTNSGGLTHNHGIYTGGTNCVYRGNVSRYNGGYGINIDGHGNPSVDIENKVYNNLIYGNYGGGTLDNPGDQIAIYDDSVTGPSSGTQTNYIWGNTVISPGAYAIICQNGNIRLTNNIIISTNDGIHKFGSFSSDVINADYNQAPQALGYSGPHDVVSSANNFVNTAHGLYWLVSTAPARGVALSTVYGPVDFFGRAQSSVTDIGAYQYNAALASDGRILDPSGAFPDYWATTFKTGTVIKGRTKMSGKLIVK